MNDSSLFAPSPEHWVPEEYQLRGVKMCLSQGAVGLFLLPGRRKTSIMLAALKILKEKKLMRSALIVAPLRVCYLVWPKEIKKWIEFNELTCEILHGPKKNEAVKRKADIYLLNPAGFEWFFKEKRTNADVFVCDESTLLKHTNTKRFKLLKPHLNRFRRRYILTGTPAPRSYEDLFGQIYILDGGNALGRYITHYRMKYFYQSGFGGYDWTLMPGMEEKIQERIAPLIMQLSADDQIKLPELVENPVYVELPLKAQKIYDELEEEFLVELEGETITAATAATASMKLRQCCGGFIYNAEKKGIDIHDAKLDACKSLVDELNGNPVLIAYEFEHDKKRLIELFGKDTPFLGGGVTPKRSQWIEEGWNAGQIPVLLGQPQSMGHGLNLQGSGNTLIWFTLPWNLESYLQTVRRLLRSGQKASHVYVHFLLARGTLDEAVLKSLQGKDRTQTKLLDALRAYGKAKRNTK